MKPTKKFEVIYDKLKLLNHKAYELMIKFRNTTQTDYEMEWKNHQNFIKDDMINYMEKDGRKLSKGEMEVANGYWKLYGKALQDN